MILNTLSQSQCSIQLEICHHYYTEMVTSTLQSYVHVQHPVVDLVEGKAVNNAGIYEYTDNNTCVTPPLNHLLLHVSNRNSDRLVS